MLGVAVLATLMLAIQAPTLQRPVPAHAFTDADFVADELLVRFREGPSRSLRAATLGDIGATVLDTYQSSGVVRLQVPPGSLVETQQRLLERGIVEFAEPNYRLRVAQLVPVDPLYTQEQATIYERIDGPGGWAVSTGSHDVVVALIDGAVDLDHPDLAANIWTNAGEIPDNGKDDDGNGFVDDVHGYDFVGDWLGGNETKPTEDSDPDAAPGDTSLGDGVDQDFDGKPDGAFAHGTQVAGILGAVGDNGVGIVGAAWQASIMPIRVTSPEGDGLFSGLIAALDYAVINGADVANISLAASVLPEAARAAVDAAVEMGMIIVAAAGNNGSSVAFPGALPNVIAVGSTDGEALPPAEPVAEEGAKLRAAGAFGPPFFTPAGPEIEFVAPGVDVPATSVTGEGEPEYDFVTGTSFSAPFVTGTVVLILALAPASTLSDVRARLQAGSEDLPDANRINWDGGENGGGLINIGLTMLEFAAQAPSAALLIRAEVVGDVVEFEGEAEAGSTVTIFSEDGQPEASELEEGAFSLAVAGAEEDPFPPADGDDADVGEPADEIAAGLPPGAIAVVVPDEAGRFSATVSLSAFDETSAVVTITVAASREGAVSPLSEPVVLALPFDVELVAGWNLVGWAGSSGASADVLMGLPARVLRLFAWDGQVWTVAVPGDPLFRIEEIRTGQALWVLVAPGPAISWRQSRVPYAAAQLVPGWQLVAWTGVSGEVEVAAAQTPATIESIYAWDAGGQSFRAYLRHIPMVSTLEQLAHFQGVWVVLESGQAGGAWPGPATTLEVVAP